MLPAFFWLFEYVFAFFSWFLLFKLVYFWTKNRKNIYVSFFLLILCHWFQFWHKRYWKIEIINFENSDFCNSWFQIYFDLANAQLVQKICDTFKVICISLDTLNFMGLFWPKKVYLDSLFFMLIKFLALTQYCTWLQFCKANSQKYV